MSDRIGYLYKLTAPNGKSYIGQTVQQPCKRMSKHYTKAMKGKDENQCRALGNAIRKYGWDNFTKEIITDCFEFELDFLETEFIEMYNSLYPNGYNLTKGGRNGPNTLSEETRQHMSDVATYKSKRVYEKRDNTLPRCVQRWKNSYRVEMNVNRKRIHKCFNITKYGDEEALRLAKEFVLQQRPDIN